MKYQDRVIVVDEEPGEELMRYAPVESKNIIVEKDNKKYVKSKLGELFILPNKPKCFKTQSQWEVWCMSSVGTHIKFTEFCVDCTAEYQMRMKKEKLCRYPRKAVHWCSKCNKYFFGKAYKLKKNSPGKIGGWKCPVCKGDRWKK